MQRKKLEKKHKSDEQPSIEFEDEFEDAQESKKISASKDIEVNSAELLSYQTIQEGMVIMGSVKSVNSVCVHVALPGRITGKVIASNVSDSYNKILSQFIQSSSGIMESYKPLTHMFQIGRIVYAKVMEIKDNGVGKTEINLSLKPRDVHSDLVHKKFRKGMIMNCAIEEVQEHGFIMESSIRNLRAFLPKEKVMGDSKDYSVGMLITIKIEKLTQNNAASTAICRELNSDNTKIKDLTYCNLDYILPGVTVNFLVTAHLKDGLRGTIMNGDFAAYINEHHLTTPLTTVDSIKLNSTVNAKVLYIMPLTKLVYLTLNLDPIPVETDYHRGDIVEKAVVSRVGSGGIVFVLNGQHKGLLSMKSIKSIGNYDIDVIMNKYTKKSKHTVRILEYDAVDSLYICTDDEKAVAEKYFAITDLNVNDIVNAKVVERDQKASGYTVTIGKVKGKSDQTLQLDCFSLNEFVLCNFLHLNHAYDPIRSYSEIIVIFAEYDILKFCMPFMRCYSLKRFFLPYFIKKLPMCLYVYFSNCFLSEFSSNLNKQLKLLRKIMKYMFCQKHFYML